MKGKYNLALTTKTLYFTINNQKYEWYGGFGAVLKSKERNIQLYETRYIGKVYFHAYKINDRGWLQPKEICWVPIESIDANWMHSFLIELLGLHTHIKEIEYHS